jgi:hypothetical protein
LNQINKPSTTTAAASTVAKVPVSMSIAMSSRRYFSLFNDAPVLKTHRWRRQK